MAQSNIIHWRV